MARGRERVRFYRTVQRAAQWALLAVGVLIVAGFIPFSLRALSQAAYRLASGADIDTCEIESVTLTLWQGAVLKGVRCVKAFDDGTEVSVAAERVVVSFRPFYALSHRDALRRFFGQVAFDRRGIPPSARRGPGGGRLNPVDPMALLPVVGRVFLEGATCAVGGAHGDTVLIRGGQARLRIADAGGVRMHGRMQADTLRYGIWQIDGTEARFRTDNGRLDLDRIRGCLYHGRVSGGLVLDTRRKRIESGSFSAKEVDLKTLYTSRPGRKGRLSGKAAFSVKLQPGSWENNLLRGEGGFDLKDVTPDEIPILTTMVISLTVPQLSRIHLDRVTGTFVIDTGFVHCAHVRGEGHPIDIECSGTVKQNGQMNLDVTATFDPEYKDSLSGLAWNVLIPTDEGGRQFLCSITGTFDSPKVSINRQITRRAVRNVFGNIGREIRSALGRK